MPTFFERYHGGDHVQVWNELVALGESVREKKYYADAVAVAAETMRRARHNIERLLPRLAQAGYRFVAPSDEENLEQWRQAMKTAGGEAASAAGGGLKAARSKKKPSKRAEQEALARAQLERLKMRRLTALEAKVAAALEKPPHMNRDVFAPTGKEVSVHLKALEEMIDGPLPISLHAWYEKVGAVSLLGSHEVLNPKGSAIADPLVIWPLDTKASRSAFEDVEDDGGTMEFYIAPDDSSKANMLGKFYSIRIPNPAADAPVESEWHDTTFVGYLRKTFEWGGFPGWERDQNPPRTSIAKLTEGLLPL